LGDSAYPPHHFWWTHPPGDLRLQALIEEHPVSCHDLAALALPTTVSQVRHCLMDFLGSSLDSSTSVPSAAEAFTIPAGFRREAASLRQCSLHFALQYTLCLTRRWNFSVEVPSGLGLSCTWAHPFASTHARAVCSQLSPLGGFVNQAFRSGRK
jgi:hypothetical protein